MSAHARVDRVLCAAPSTSADAGPLDPHSRLPFPGDLQRASAAGEHVTLRRSLPPNATARCTRMVLRDRREVKLSPQACHCSVHSELDWHFLEMYHEPQLVYAVLHSTRAKTAFIDIGANIGLYSVLALERFAEVLSFEPQPYCIDNMLYTKQRAGAANWRMWNAVVGSQRQNVFGHICGMNWLWNPMRRPRTHRAQAVPLTEVVRMVRRPEEPLFIKVDTDGGEDEVAEQLVAMLPPAPGGATTGKLAALPEVYMELGLNSGDHGRLLQLYGKLGSFYSDVFLFSSYSTRANTCEHEALKGNFTTPHLTVARRRPATARMLGVTGELQIRRVVDWPGLLVACVRRGAAAHVWFAA